MIGTEGTADKGQDVPATPRRRPLTFRSIAHVRRDFRGRMKFKKAHLTFPEQDDSSR